MKTLLLHLVSTKPNCTKFEFLWVVSTLLLGIVLEGYRTLLYILMVMGIIFGDVVSDDIKKKLENSHETKL
jgi:hypothetical protein